MNSQKGFTLIELVVVIVILGILAVTAAPKFINIQDDARTATLQAVKASMQSAATLVHSKSLIEGNEAATTATVMVNGVAEPIALGYPRSNDAAAATSWGNLLDLNSTEFTIVYVDDSIVVHPVGKTAPATIPTSPYAPTAEVNCFAFYTEASATTATPPVLTERNIQVVSCL
ncbi:type II secretion system protein [Colwellia ponticola]|uniref:Type II secretion system protein n=2 Tax=Colwellia ponticola TaxID=2304625 RepID=A0A8H2PPI0_9GAMM|nr:type II secretion system protein [Colwellia ponticola]